MKIYCEHGALLKTLRRLARAHDIKLVHFPYDPDSRSTHLEPSAVPSAAQWRDVHMTWKELGWTWDDFSGSEHLRAIRRIVGTSNRRDALHVDSAYKSGCSCFVTTDSDILGKRGELEALLGISFCHPKEDALAIEELVRTHAPHEAAGPSAE